MLTPRLRDVNSVELPILNCISMLLMRRFIMILGGAAIAASGLKK